MASASTAGVVVDHLGAQGEAGELPTGGAPGGRDRQGTGGLRSSGQGLLGLSWPLDPGGAQRRGRDHLSPPHPPVMEAEGGWSWSWRKGWAWAPGAGL